MYLLSELTYTFLIFISIIELPLLLFGHCKFKFYVNVVVCFQVLVYHHFTNLLYLYYYYYFHSNINNNYYYYNKYLEFKKLMGHQVHSCKLELLATS